MGAETKSQSFKEILETEPLVLVDFFAVWCGPCKIMAPVLEQVKSKAGDRLRILKVDVDRSPEASAAYKIMAVPTLILFQNGKPVWRQSGIVSEKVILDLVSAYSPQ